jgi:hypothetical protein
VIYVGDIFFTAIGLAIDVADAMVLAVDSYGRPVWSGQRSVVLLWTAAEELEERMPRAARGRM